MKISNRLKQEIKTRVSGDKKFNWNLEENTRINKIFDYLNKEEPDIQIQKLCLSDIPKIHPDAKKGIEHFKNIKLASQKMKTDVKKFASHKEYASSCLKEKSVLAVLSLVKKYYKTELTEDELREIIEEQNLTEVSSLPELENKMFYIQEDEEEEIQKEQEDVDMKDSKQTLQDFYNGKTKFWV